jgi:SAM-dependent methyltransferase
MKSQEMGAGTSDVFAGNDPSEVIQIAYGESPAFFAKMIRSVLGSETERMVRILDVGSFNGEMFECVVALLPEYTIERHAVDVNAEAMRQNNAEHTYIAPAGSIPLPDASIDIVLSRYALQWNTLEDQERMLREMLRVARRAVILEHAGAPLEDTSGWRAATDDLFSGQTVPELKRDVWHYSTRVELEDVMRGLPVHVERVGERRIECLSSIFIQRYALPEMAAARVREVLAGHDCFVQTRWVLRPERRA